MLLWSVSRCYHSNQGRLCVAYDLPLRVFYQLFLSYGLWFLGPDK